MVSPARATATVLPSSASLLVQGAKKECAPNPVPLATIARGVTPVVVQRIMASSSVFRALRSPSGCSNEESSTHAS